MTVHRCRECSSEMLFPHCDKSSACDLWRCSKCNAFGTIDGRLWVPKVRVA